MKTEATIIDHILVLISDLIDLTPKHERDRLNRMLTNAYMKRDRDKLLKRDSECLQKREQLKGG